MKTWVCFVLILTVSVATDVQVYVYGGESFPRPNPVPRDAFRFDYHYGNVITMQIFLIFPQVNVTPDLYLQYTSGGVNVEEKVEPTKLFTGGLYYEMKRNLSVSEIVVDMELNTTTGICTRKQIVRGNVVTGPNETSKTPYDSSCLQSPPCMVNVYLSNDVNATVKVPNNAELPTSTCKHMETTTIKSTVSDTTLSTQTSQSTTSAKPNTLAAATRPVPDVTTLSSTVESSVTKTPRNGNIEVTTTQMTRSETDATTPEYTMVLTLSLVFGAVVIVVVIIVVCKCCKKRNPSGASHLLTTTPCGPFYVNMLFRDQCAQEIADIENHQYEEIGENPNQETENLYEEIVPK